jgi:hypothetical protein
MRQHLGPCVYRGGGGYFLLFFVHEIIWNSGAHFYKTDSREAFWLCQIILCMTILPFVCSLWIHIRFSFFLSTLDVRSAI